MGSPLMIRSVLYLAILLIGASARAEQAPAPPPLKPGLTEGVESRLVQFEVRVTHKGVPVPGLTAQDFDIEIGSKPLERFVVDNMCTGGFTTSRPGSFVFYFDEPELTVDGRRRAIEVARLVAPELLEHGHDVLILRNGVRLRAETKWTHDPAEVTAALDRIAEDPGDGVRVDNEELLAQRLLDLAAISIRESDWSRQSAQRDAESLKQNSQLKCFEDWDNKTPSGFQDGTITPGMTSAARNAVNYNMIGNAAIARLVDDLSILVQNDLRRSERDIERLRETVRSLSLRASPKGVAYFADTLRRDPGAAIAKAVESVATFTNRNDVRWRSAIAGWNADAAITALVRDASTFGARFYAVEGRGLVGPSEWVRMSQDTLATLAAETGGLSFVNGLVAQSIANRIAADQSCWYLVSFDPKGWDTDRTLHLGVWGKKPGLRVNTHSNLVIPSRGRLTETRLLAGHFGDPISDDQPLSVSIYPLGGTSKTLQVLAQIRLPASTAPNELKTNWDVGFEVVSQQAVVSHTSGRVSWRGNGQPLVYQATLSVPAGSYEIIAVAHEVDTDAIREGRVTGTWPASSADRVTLSLPVLAQPQSGGIVLDGNMKDSGIVIRGDGTLVDPRKPVAIVTAVCMGTQSGAVFRAERRLVGETDVPFAPMQLTPDEGRCVQIRDLVVAGSLGAGQLTYFLRILSGDNEVVAQQLSFGVADISALTLRVASPTAD